MITKREIIYAVKELLNKSSDDSNITNEFIGFLVDTGRVKLTRQRLGEIRRNVSSTYKQEVLLQLEGISNVLGGKIMRSTLVVPTLLDINSIDNRSTLTSNLNIVKSFTMVSYDRLAYVGKRSHMSSLIYGAIGHDNKLYINSGDGNHKLMSSVKLWGIYDDPEAAWKLSSVYNPAIKFWDTEYPIEVSLVPDLIEYVTKQLGIPVSIPEDKINDGEDT